MISIRRARKIFFDCAELTLPLDSLYTLDPTLIAHRLREEIKYTVVCLGDYAQLPIDFFHEMDGAERAVLVAEADARRRGPIWTFRIYVDGIAVVGAVERRRLWIHRDGHEIPVPLKQPFMDFLESLDIPGCTIGSYRLEGNSRTAT